MSDPVQQRTMTIDEAIKALPEKMSRDWVDELFSEGFEISYADYEDEDNAEEKTRERLRRGFYWAVRAALEHLAPIAVNPDPEDDE
jgi:hypothetical protein